MKRSIRIFALVLCLCLAFSLAACNSSSSEETEAPATETPAAEASATEEPSAEETEPAAEGVPANMELPLVEEPTTLSLWTTVNPSALRIINDYSENTVIQYAAELTNIYLECTSVAGNLAGEQFSIMIASNDYTDYIGSMFTLYSEGIDAAIDNEIIIDLTPYLEEYAPNYYEVLNSNEDFVRNLTTDEGRMGCFGMLSEGFQVDAGYMTRLDWLNALNLDVPETYDDWYNTLKAMNTEYGATLYVNPIGVGSRNTLTDGYGIAVYTDANNADAIPFYVKEGEVMCGYTAPEFQDYLAMMAQWYAEGLVWQDFPTGGATISIKSSEAYSSFLNSEISFGVLEMGDLYTTPANSADPDMELIAVPDPVLNAGDSTHIASAGLNSAGTASWAISTQCEDVELAVEYINFWFTDEGAELGNYGLEGEAFNWVDGERVWTDLLINNPDGLAFKALATIYLLDDQPFHMDIARSNSIYSPEELECSDIWLSNRLGDWEYPTSVSLTSEEGSVYSTYMNDIITYAEETIPQFILGQLDVEADFQAFVDQLYEMGLQECIDVRQSAYDRYMTR